MFEFIIVEGKLLRLIFFEDKMLLQPEVVFYSGRNSCSLAPLGGEKKILDFHLSEKTEKRPRLTSDVILKKNIKIFFSRHQVELES